MGTALRILISGWFSFDLPYNTAGDLLAKDTAVQWATEAGFICDVAVPNPKNQGEVKSDETDPNDYIAAIFVCGPLTSRHIGPYMQKFKSIKRIALNVSVVDGYDLSSEFDVIIPRDARGVANPDLSLATKATKTPVVGLIYVGPQKEYPTQRHALVEEIVSEVVKEMDLAVVPIDTKLPQNEFGLTSISQVESVIGAMDFVITTRLHGSLLSLRNGVPVISIDPVPHGAKVLSQMRTVGWPLAYSVDELDKEKLKQAVQKALSAESRDLALKLTDKVTDQLAKVKETFLSALRTEKSK